MEELLRLVMVRPAVPRASPSTLSVSTITAGSTPPCPAGSMPWTTQTRTTSQHMPRPLAAISARSLPPGSPLTAPVLMRLRHGLGMSPTAGPALHRANQPPDHENIGLPLAPPLNGRLAMPASGPRGIVTLRNLPITILRLSGHPSIAAGRPLQTIMN